VAIRLTEVEAYAGGSDPGSHAFRGVTPRTAVMFGAPGHAYVYFSYGIHWCLNVVCQPDGVAGAVLLRAGEVMTGRSLAAARRNSTRPRSRSVPDVQLARGPANLAKALHIDGAWGGQDLLDPAATLRLERDDREAPEQIASGPRVGLRQAAAAPWRFWVVGDPTVSSYRPANPRR
jgi:DNA-3-methyladenine glycosylase